MKQINKLGPVITKILEVFHWVGTALMAAATVCSVAAPQWVGYFVGYEPGSELNVYGFEMEAPAMDSPAFLLFGICAVVILALMAMVFRSMYLIFKNTEKTTPFHKDNIRMLKQIGIFSIAVPVTGLVMSAILRLVLGVDNVQISVDASGVFWGIIVLCLTQYFVHGAELEKDVDGLL